MFFDAMRACIVWAVIHTFISVSGDRKTICIYDIENLSGCGGDFVCSCVGRALPTSVVFRSGTIIALGIMRDYTVKSLLMTNGRHC